MKVNKNNAPAQHYGAPAPHYGAPTPHYGAPTPQSFKKQSFKNHCLLKKLSKQLQNSHSKSRNTESFLGGRLVYPKKPLLYRHFLNKVPLVVINKNQFLNVPVGNEESRNFTPFRLNFLLPSRLSFFNRLQSSRKYYSTKNHSRDSKQTAPVNRKEDLLMNRNFYLFKKFLKNRESTIKNYLKINFFRNKDNKYTGYSFFISPINRSFLSDLLKIPVGKGSETPTLLPSVEISNFKKMPILEGTSWDLYPFSNKKSLKKNRVPTPLHSGAPAPLSLWGPYPTIFKQTKYNFYSNLGFMYSSNFHFDVGDGRTNFLNLKRRFNYFSNLTASLKNQTSGANTSLQKFKNGLFKNPEYESLLVKTPKKFPCLWKFYLNNYSSFSKSWDLFGIPLMNDTTAILNNKKSFNLKAFKSFSMPPLFQNILFEKWHSKKKQGFFYKNVNKFNIIKTKVLNKPIAHLFWELRTNWKIKNGILMLQTTKYYQSKTLNEKDTQSKSSVYNINKIRKIMLKRRRYQKFLRLETLFTWLREVLFFKKISHKIKIKKKTDYLFWNQYFNELIKKVRLDFLNVPGENEKFLQNYSKESTWGSLPQNISLLWGPYPTIFKQTKNALKTFQSDFSLKNEYNQLNRRKVESELPSFKKSFDFPLSGRKIESRSSLDALELSSNFELSELIKLVNSFKNEFSSEVLNPEEVGWGPHSTLILRKLYLKSRDSTPLLKKALEGTYPQTFTLKNFLKNRFLTFKKSKFNTNINFGKLESISSVHLIDHFNSLNKINTAYFNAKYNLLFSRSNSDNLVVSTMTVPDYFINLCYSDFLTHSQQKHLNIKKMPSTEWDLKKTSFGEWGPLPISKKQEPHSFSNPWSSKVVGPLPHNQNFFEVNTETREKSLNLVNFVKIIPQKSWEIFPNNFLNTSLENSFSEVQIQSTLLKNRNQVKQELIATQAEWDCKNNEGLGSHSLSTVSISSLFHSIFFKIHQLINNFIEYQLNFFNQRIGESPRTILPFLKDFLNIRLGKENEVPTLLPSGIFKNPLYSWSNLTEKQVKLENLRKIAFKFNTLLTISNVEWGPHSLKGCRAPAPHPCEISTPHYGAPTPHYGAPTPQSFKKQSFKKQEVVYNPLESGAPAPLPLDFLNIPKGKELLIRFLINKNFQFNTFPTGTFKKSLFNEVGQEMRQGPFSSLKPHPSFTIYNLKLEAKHGPRSIQENSIFQKFDMNFSTTKLKNLSLFSNKFVFPRNIQQKNSEFPISLQFTTLKNFYNFHVSNALLYNNMLKKEVGLGSPSSLDFLNSFKNSKTWNLSAEELINFKNKVFQSYYFLQNSVYKIQNANWNLNSNIWNNIDNIENVYSKKWTNDRLIGPLFTQLRNISATFEIFQQQFQIRRDFVLLFVNIYLNNFGASLNYLMDFCFSRMLKNQQINHLSNINIRVFVDSDLFFLKKNSNGCALCCAQPNFLNVPVEKEGGPSKVILGPRSSKEFKNSLDFLNSFGLAQSLKDRGPAPLNSNAFKYSTLNKKFFDLLIEPKWTFQILKYLKTEHSLIYKSKILGGKNKFYQQFQNDFLNEKSGASTPLSTTLRRFENLKVVGQGPYNPLESVVPTTSLPSGIFKNPLEQQTGTLHFNNPKEIVFRLKNTIKSPQNQQIMKYMRLKSSDVALGSVSNNNFNNGQNHVFWRKKLKKNKFILMKKQKKLAYLKIIRNFVLKDRVSSSTFFGSFKRVGAPSLNIQNQLKTSGESGADNLLFFRSFENRPTSFDQYSTHKIRKSGISKSRVDIFRNHHKMKKIQNMFIYFGDSYKTSCFYFLGKYGSVQPSLSGIFKKTLEVNHFQNNFIQIFSFSTQQMNFLFKFFLIAIFFHLGGLIYLILIYKSSIILGTKTSYSTLTLINKYFLALQYTFQKITSFIPKKNLQILLSSLNRKFKSFEILTEGLKSYLSLNKSYLNFNFKNLNDFLNSLEVGQGPRSSLQYLNVPVGNVLEYNKKGSGVPTLVYNSTLLKKTFTNFLSSENFEKASLNKKSSEQFKTFLMRFYNIIRKNYTYLNWKTLQITSAFTFYKENYFVKKKRSIISSKDNVLESLPPNTFFSFLNRGHLKVNTEKENFNFKFLTIFGAARSLNDFYLKKGRGPHDVPVGNEVVGDRGLQTLGIFKNPLEVGQEPHSSLDFLNIFKGKESGSPGLFHTRNFKIRFTLKFRKNLRFHYIFLIFLGESQILAELEPYRELHWLFLKKMPLLLRTIATNSDPINMYEYQADEKIRKLQQKLRKSAEILSRKATQTQQKYTRNITQVSIAKEGYFLRFKNVLQNIFLKKLKKTDSSKINLMLLQSNEMGWHLFKNLVLNNQNKQITPEIGNQYFKIFPYDCVGQWSHQSSEVGLDSRPELGRLLEKSLSEESNLTKFEQNKLSKKTYTKNSSKLYLNTITLMLKSIWSKLGQFFLVIRIGRLSHKFRNQLVIFHFPFIFLGPMISIFGPFFSKLWSIHLDQSRSFKKSRIFLMNFKSASQPFYNFKTIKFTSLFSNFNKQANEVEQGPYNLSFNFISEMENLNFRHNNNLPLNLYSLISPFINFSNITDSWAVKISEKQNYKYKINLKTSIIPNYNNSIFQYFEKVLLKYLEIKKESLKSENDFNLKKGRGPHDVSIGNEKLNYRVGKKNKPILFALTEILLKHKSEISYSKGVRLESLIKDLAKQSPYSILLGGNLGLLNPPGNLQTLGFTRMKNSTYDPKARFYRFSNNFSNTFINVQQLKLFPTAHDSIGPLVCQIYSGIFSKKIAKNILLVGKSQLKEENLFSSLQLIQAMAGETGLKFLMEDAKRLKRLGISTIKGGINKSTKRLEKLFQIAQAYAPSIVFIEDIHVIASKGLNTISDNIDLKFLRFKELCLTNRNSLSIPSAVSQNLNSTFSSDSFGSFLPSFKGFLNSPERSHLKENFSSNSQIIKPEQDMLNFSSSKTISKQPKMLIRSTRLLLWKSYKNKILNASTSNLVQPGLNILTSTREAPWVHIPIDAMRSISPLTYSIRVKVAKLTLLSASTIGTNIFLIKYLIKLFESLRYDNYQNFVVFATTNNLSLIDSSLRQPGRLEETIFLNLKIKSPLYDLTVSKNLMQELLNFSKTFNKLNISSFLTNYKIHNIFNYIQQDSEIFPYSSLSLGSQSTLYPQTSQKQKLLNIPERNLSQRYYIGRGTQLLEESGLHSTYLLKENNKKLLNKLYSIKSQILNQSFIPSKKESSLLLESGFQKFFENLNFRISKTYSQKKTNRFKNKIIRAITLREGEPDSTSFPIVRPLPHTPERFLPHNHLKNNLLKNHDFLNVSVGNVNFKQTANGYFSSNFKSLFSILIITGYQQMANFLLPLFFQSNKNIFNISLPMNKSLKVDQELRSSYNSKEELFSKKTLLFKRVWGTGSTMQGPYSTQSLNGNANILHRFSQQNHSIYLMYLLLTKVIEFLVFNYPIKIFLKNQFSTKILNIPVGNASINYRNRIFKFSLNLCGFQTSIKNHTINEQSRLLFSILAANNMYVKKHSLTKFFYLEDVLKKTQKSLSENLTTSILFEYLNINTNLFKDSHLSYSEENLKIAQHKKYWLHLEGRPVRKYITQILTTKSISEDGDLTPQFSQKTTEFVNTVGQGTLSSFQPRLSLFRVLFNEFNILSDITTRPTQMNYYYFTKIQQKQKVRKFAYRWWNWHLKKPTEFLEEFQYLEFFPYMDKKYNPRHRRWMLSNGFWNYWGGFHNSFDFEIYEQWIIETFQLLYKKFDNSREILDYCTQLLISKQTRISELDLCLCLLRFSKNPI
uniref:Cell division protein n=1 Tax=Koshicola spirodelophila TaxID=1707787 RepID=A0A160E6T3_9CHLO|nr:cell division protein [Koshicola spirodelophila]